MLSTTSLVLFGVIALIAVIAIWKWWKKPNNIVGNQIKDSLLTKNDFNINEHTPGPPENESPTHPPPMVFAVNDNGILDLTDLSGNILNSSFGPNPKVYINLLDQAEKDTSKEETENGVKFISNVGNTKSYTFANKPYIINYTRLV
jgi:hypothetical protein